jgi:hypothetical protein
MSRQRRRPDVSLHGAGVFTRLRRCRQDHRRRGNFHRFFSVVMASPQRGKTDVEFHHETYNEMCTAL